MDEDSKRPSNEKKIKFRTNILGTTKESRQWIIIITIISFLISASLSLLSSSILQHANYLISCTVVFIIILINIFFDIVGTAVTAADEAPFHAMASRKLYGARQTIRLIRNADKVSNFCNDVVGDICGVISGAASTYIIAGIVSSGINPETSIAGLSITGMVASLTVGGKAMGKTIAIKNSNYIIYKVAVILKFLFGRINFVKMKNKKKKE